MNSKYCKKIIYDFKDKLKKFYDDLKNENKNDRNHLKKIIENVNNHDYDYEDTLLLEYYLLKYGIAYFFDYSIVYRLIIKNSVGETMKSFNWVSASLGCGSGNDKISLDYAFNYLLGVRGDYDWYLWKGYDISREWIDVVGDDWIQRNEFKCKSAVSYFSELTTPPCFEDGRMMCMTDHVIMFPRSFGDIMRNTNFDELLDLVKKCKFNTDEIFLCIVHTNDAGLDITSEDYEKADKFLSALSETLRNQGYEKKKMNISSVPELEYNDKAIEYMTFKNQNQKISNIDENFSEALYNVTKWVNDINELVMGEGMNPITTVNYSNYQILHFVKN